MRVVADTNTVVSGLLWHGPPYQVLSLARAGRIDLFTSAGLLAELDDVLHREKFARRLAMANIKASDLVIGYAALAKIVKPATIAPVIIEDPDDDAVLACAVAALAETIVTGDAHLLKLKEYNSISILSASEFLSQFMQGSKPKTRFQNLLRLLKKFFKFS